jgi:enamine deaminase RidA (YjgF/YER057c/UK114 family)
LLRSQDSLIAILPLLTNVINDASDLLVVIFGDRGKHARAAVGVSSLPLDSTVELEFIAEI